MGLSFDNTQALSEGWAISDCGNHPSGPWQLQRLDEAAIFCADADAWIHVGRQAAQGSEYHKSALRFIREHSPREFTFIFTHSGMADFEGTLDMPNYMDGEWHLWTSGKQPVPDDVEVEALWINPETKASRCFIADADDIAWVGDATPSGAPIHSFRVLPKKPTYHKATIEILVQGKDAEEAGDELAAVLQHLNWRQIEGPKLHSGAGFRA